MPKSRWKARSPRRFVIDASVARAAGGQGAKHPVSRDCRDFLTEVYTVCHNVVLTSDIGEEWKRHKSSFARTWLCNMYGKKGVVRRGSQEDDLLRSAIETTINDQSRRNVALKDMRLVEAALATDRIIVSLDDTARSIFTSVSEKVATLRDILWVNPAKREEKIIAWLRNGATPEEHRRLGSGISDTSTEEPGDD